MLSRPPPLLPVDHLGAEQLRWDGMTREITPYAPVRQVFSCAQGGLRRIEVFLENRDRSNCCHLWLSLFEGDTGGLARSGRPPAIRTVGPLRAESLLSAGWFAFEFEPVGQSGGKLFTIVFDSPDASFGNALSLRKTDQGAAGLLFRAVCLRAPRLLPNLQRLRAGRRGEQVDYHPSMVRLEISRPCNLGCIMCYRGVSPFDPTREGPGFMSLETVQALDPILPSLLWVIAFGLGEPFLNRNFLAILRHIRGANPFAHVFTSTNATLLNEKAIQAIVSEELISTLQISIDGATKETYEAVRRNGDYRTVIRNLERVIEERRKCGSRNLSLRTEMLVMKPTVFQVFDFIEQMASLGVDSIMLDSVKGARFKDLRVDDDDAMARIYDQVERGHRLLQGTSSTLDGCLLIELRNWREKRGGARGVPQFGDEPIAVMASPDVKRRPPCGVPWESLILNTDGQARVCCTSDRLMGHISREGLAAVWERGEPYQKLRSEMLDGNLHPHCAGCMAENIFVAEQVIPGTYLDACLIDQGQAAAWSALAGRRLGDLEVVEDPGCQVEFDQGDSGPMASKHPPAIWRPSGWLIGSKLAGGRQILVISVNSVIRGWAIAHGAVNGSARWAAAIEGGSPPAPQDRVEVLRVLRNGPELLLGRLAGRPRIVPEKFEPISEPSVHGFVDEIRFEGGFLVLRGWARDARRNAPASHVGVLLDGRLTSAGRPWLRRPDVAAAHGGPDTAYGFSLEVPCAAFDSQPGRQQVKVVAWEPGGETGELLWSGGDESTAAFAGKPDSEAAFSHRLVAGQKAAFWAKT
jgi:MoaA/NifB/PqqE/SkfB family radical SAM enzyme